MTSTRPTRSVVGLWVVLCAAFLWWLSEAGLQGWWSGLIIAASLGLGFAARQERTERRLTREWFRRRSTRSGL